MARSSVPGGHSTNQMFCYFYTVETPFLALTLLTVQADLKRLQYAGLMLGGLSYMCRSRHRLKLTRWVGRVGSWCGRVGSWCGRAGSWCGRAGSWCGRAGSWCGRAGSWCGANWQLVWGKLADGVGQTGSWWGANWQLVWGKLAVGVGQTGSWVGANWSGDSWQIQIQVFFAYRFFVWT